MRINKTQPMAFKAARINIVANSDNHGNVASMDSVYNTICVNKDRIFQKSNEDSTLNLYINAGDFFINGNKKGWRKGPNYTNFDIQKNFLRLLILKMKKQADIVSAKNAGEPKKAKFDALYTPGNHCFDGGDKKLYEALGSVDGLTTIMTNIDPNRSQALTKYDFDYSNSKFVSSKEYEIPDDKDKDKKHHLMVLGVTIPAMDYYNPGLIKDTEFLDKNNKKDAKMGKEDIKGTITAVRKKVNAFKKEHPEGIVILSSHMGTGLSKIIRDEVPGINEILDGHKHDIVTTRKGNTNISSLGEDNKILKTIALQIEDDGSIEREDIVYQVDQYKLSQSETNSIKRLYQGYTDEDLKKKIRIYDHYKAESEPVLSISNRGSEVNPYDFSYTETIRYSNSTLANFLTSALKEEIVNLEGQEDVDIVGVQSSIIRGGLKNGASTFDLMKVFDGVSEGLSNIKSGKVTGQELIDIVYENIEQNIENKTRNTIIQWSDVQVNRYELELLKHAGNVTEEDKRKNILVRGKDGKFTEIDPNKEYKIAIADKYLIKDDIKMPAKIRERFKETGVTYHELFMQYLERDERPETKENDIDTDFTISYTRRDGTKSHTPINPSCAEYRVISEPLSDIKKQIK